MTNLVVCRCGEQRRYWEVPADEEPFHLGRYAKTNVAHEEALDEARRLREGRESA